MNLSYGFCLIITYKSTSLNVEKTKPMQTNASKLLLHDISKTCDMC